jgi:hypothetical protein
MVGTAQPVTNTLVVVLRELGWSQTRLVAELRREAARQRVTLTKTESLVTLISRWVNNHQQPSEFYRELLSEATGRSRAELFSDDAAVVLLTAQSSSGVVTAAAPGSAEEMKRRQLLMGTAAFGAALAAERLTPAPQGVAPWADLLHGQPIATGETEQEIIAAIRRVLLGFGPFSQDVTNGARLSIDALRRRVSEAWHLRQGSHYLDLGRQLPALLADAQLASRELAGDDQGAAVGLTVHAYNATSSVLRKLGDSGLAVIAADRAVQAARMVGDPLLVSASAYRLANVFLPAGRLVEAKEVALSAAAGLEDRLDASTVGLAMWGSLLLTAALATARQGDNSETWELVGEAKAAARRLGIDYADLHTIFGPTSVAISGVQIAAELGDGREVLRRAQLVEPTRLPPDLVERRSHFLIDVARGHAYRSNDAEAVTTLLEAERLAPEEIRYNPLAGNLVVSLLKRERRAATPELRALSGRIGAVA